MRFVPIVLLSALSVTIPFQAALAQVAPSLGTAQSFAVLAGSTATNTGPTVVTGDLGVSPGTAVTGFPPGTVAAGVQHSADAVALQAQSDTTTAYNALAGQACTATFGVPTDLVGQTLVSGVYCFSSSGSLTGTLTLDGQGNPNSVWIFKTGSTFITGSAATVRLVNGAQNCNVFWQIGSSATLGTSTTFVGNILALTSISLNTNAILAGRALARNGAVTMDSNLISASFCAVPPVLPIPPTIGKAFGPATINAGGTSTLTITLSSADPTDATLSSALTDTLPSGVVVATGTQTNTCGGTLSAPVGGSTVTLGTGAIIPHSGSCIVSVPVTAANGGSYINSIAAGSLITSNGPNAAPAVATLTVSAPAVVAPTVGKAFGPASINAGGTSTLTITLSNADSSAATLSAALTDTLPTGVLVATGTQTNTCGGTLTATVGGSTVTLGTGAVIPVGSCAITVPVIAASGGNYINSIAAGALQTNNGNSPAPAIATLTVISPTIVVPTVGKTFDPASINAGGTSTLTITLNNTGSSADTLSAPLTDTMPGGMVIATGAQTNSCGGTLTATVGSSTMTLSTGAVIPVGSCAISVPVSAASGGNYINSMGAGALQTNNGNNPAPAIATLTVISPTAVTLGKTFNAATITAGGSSILTITLSNVGPTATLSAPLTDTLPIGVVVAIGSQVNLCGGTLTATVGGSTVTLTGASIPANGSCTITVPVTAPVAGSFFNSLPAGALQTNNGNNAAPAIATLIATPIIAPGLSLNKTASPTTYSQAGQVITYTYVLTNTGNIPISGPFTVTDDKLGTFSCTAVASLGVGASVTCTKTYTTQASNLGKALPTNVIANINTGLWLHGVLSTQDTTITGAGPLVPNGVYAAWCIEDHVPTDLHNQPATLYSSIGGSLPADVAGLPWGAVNYVLNHKTRTKNETNVQFYEDVQTAIWLLIGDKKTDFPVTANAKQMVSAALAHSNFVPGPTDVIAIIIHSDGIQLHPKPGSIQESIFEMKNGLGSIVNKATGAGLFGNAVVQSLQVQATVNQK